MDWEQTKENCVPIRQGRSKAALQELADPTVDVLEAKRRELWAEVVDYKGEDPLEAWQRYIKWMQEYGVGGGKADLLKVLEACTKELQKYPRYMNDIRFLRIWIQYADCLPDPGDVFLYLKEKNIGRDFALYYEAYATYYELKGNFQSADAVYMDGAQRGAKPLERLKQKHSAFQQRMAQRIQRRIQDEQVLGPPPPEPVRSSLATVGARSGGRSHQAGQQQQSAMGSIFGAAAPQPQQAMLGGSRPGGNVGMRGPRPTVGIMADEEFADPENAPAGLPGYSSMPQVNNLRELKPYGVIRKENLERPTAWSQAAMVPGATAPAAGGGGGGGGGLEIFTDDEFKEEDEQPGPLPRRSEPGLLMPGLGGAATSVGPASSHPLLSQQAGGFASAGVDLLISGLAPLPSLLRGAQPGAAEQSSDLLRRSMSSAATTRSAMHGSLSSAPLAAPAAAVPAARDPGVVALGPSAAGPVAMPAAASAAGNSNAADGDAPMGQQDGGVEEMSYEELRAAAWFKRNPMAASRTGIATSSACENPGPAAQLGRSSNLYRPAATVSLASTSTAPVSNTAPACRGAVGVPYTACEAAAAPATAAVSTARRDPFGRIPQGDSSGLSDGRPPEQPSTSSSALASRHDDNAGLAPGAKRRVLGDAAASARGPMAPLCEAASAGAFVPQQPEQLQPRQHYQSLAASAAPMTAPAVPPPPAAIASAPSNIHRHDAPQPTVTISTRGAFDILNSMFSDDLPHQHQRMAQQPFEQQQLPQPARSAAPPVASAPQARPLPLQPRAAAAPVESQPWVHQPAAAPVPAAQPPPASVAHEPTVTLYTREAFDAINDMFSDSLPHEEARKLARRAAVENGNTTSFKPITNSDVRRLANMGRASLAPGAAPAPFGHSVGSAPYGGGGSMGMAASAAPSLAIHEDTFFLGPAAASLSADGGMGSSGSGGCGPSFRAGPQQSGPSGPGPAIYEDTDFIPRGPSRGPGGLANSSGGGGGGCSAPAAAAPPSGAFIFEDTEFITRPQGLHMAAAAAGGAASGSGAENGRGFGAAGSGRGLAGGGSMPFGTASRAGGPAAGRAVAAGPSRGLVARASAAEPVRQPHGASRGSLQIYEDTQYMD